ncbi:hypothetical protein NDU88_011786 [Pleurodeles waltl]|uniref:Uncharacterized protein n=1 Tax=Pleurodeles waltl TaxID=8319 RepID=A0AAV7QZR7_PLEWA|nr:hypothetical protein NDU88_011786 [Pleurodeles waltl]
MGPINIENAHITAYPDYTTEVQRKRATFVKAKQVLRDNNISHSLMFPARLRVVDGDRTHIFLTSEDAWTWLHAKGLVDPVEESTEQKEWLAQHPRRRKKPSKGTTLRPSKSQAVYEQAQALKEANMFSVMRTPAGNGASITDSDSSGCQHSPPSSPLTSGPAITPCTADDL